MITPRRTRLHRVADLHAFRLRIFELAHDPDGWKRRLVIVPNRAAASQLEKEVGRKTPDPFFVTRDELYDRLHANLAMPPRRLTDIEREVVAHACAREARGGPVRPGLVPEILRFYDQLRRQGQAVSRFEALLTDALAGDAEFDRGAERLLQQTQFLGDAFRRYETRLIAADAVDEHRLRDRLVAEPAPDPVRHIVATIGDWISEPDGLFPADYDLLSRIAGLARLDIVATERVLASGFHERIHQWLPGIEEVRGGGPSIRPAVLAPEAASERPVYVHRDRTEELNAVARRIRLGAVSPAAAAVVYRRPLPYLLLARETFGRSGIKYVSGDGFPLAAEAFAAALDLVFDAVESGFTRTAVVALLRSPHFAFPDVTRESVSAADRYLSSPYVRFVGGVDRLVELADADIEPSSLRSAAPALSAAARVAERLRPLASAERASVHLQRLIDFLNGLTPTPTADGSVAARLERGRRAVMGTLASLASAYAAHDDAVVSIEDVISRVRRAIEAQTFVADDPDEDGAVRLMDDHAARYAQADELAVVGLIDGEWPERPIRNIFFPTSLIAALGWPTERDRRAASEARFLDLLGSATKSVTVSTVKLDDEAIVEPSPFVDEIVRAGLSVIEPADADGAPDAYADAAPDSDWAALRRSAPARDMPAFHGQTVATDPRAWSVSALETYLGCPFKFFAQHVLALDEDPEDEEILDPRRQGELVHRVFEDFFREWQDAGRGAITPDSLGDARALFASIVEREVAALPEAEAALERTRLLGSPVAAGLGEAVFLMEAERPMPVVDRLLEWTLTGTFRVSVDGADRDVRLRGKADRVDLLADGTFRVIDYKLGRAPNRTRALQLPVYGLCAEQQLQRERGRLWTLSEAAYIAFREPKRVVPLFSSHEEKAEVLASAQQRLIGTLDRIAAGEFPPTPDDVFRCETCAFASVCRKDYVGDV